MKTITISWTHLWTQNRCEGEQLWSSRDPKRIFLFFAMIFYSLIQKYLKYENHCNISCLFFFIVQPHSQDFWYHLPFWMRYLLGSNSKSNFIFVFKRLDSCENDSNIMNVPVVPKLGWEASITQQEPLQGFCLSAMIFRSYKLQLCRIRK